MEAVSLDRVRDLVLVREDPDSVELAPENVENDSVAEVDAVSRERRDLELRDEDSRLLVRVLLCAVSVVVTFEAEVVEYGAGS